MTTTLIYTVLLVVIVVVVWITARRAGRVQKELEYAKQDNRRQRTSEEILSRYINLSNDELTNRVREKRKTACERMSTKD